MLFVETSGRFNPGRLVATPAVLEAVPREELLTCYSRHLCCDWGEVVDRSFNDCALQSGGRLLSVYKSKAGVKFCIITEADRSATIFLLPSDH